jgi:glycosyltransferase involved in cell wall biosynthesis
MESVSIVMPTLNCEATVDRALRSAVAQTHTQREILVCDGASTDRTLSIARSFGDAVNVRSQPDTDVYDAMNGGLRRARGDWVYFLGADDYLIANTVLAAVFGELETTHYDFIYGNVLFGEACLVYDGPFSFGKLLRKNICHQATFIRRSALLALGGFDRRYPTLADWDLHLRVYLEPKVRRLFTNRLICHYSNRGLTSLGRDLKEQERLLRTYRSKRLGHLARRVLRVLRPR